MTVKDKYYIRVKSTLVEVTHEFIWLFIAPSGKSATKWKKKAEIM